MDKTERLQAIKCFPPLYEVDEGVVERSDGREFNYAGEVSAGMWVS